MDTGKGIAIAGIWLGIGLCSIGMGIAGAEGVTFGVLGVLGLCGMLATLFVAGT